MSRPSIAVVMPFAGDTAAAAEALGALGALDAEQLILADNAGTAPVSETVTVVRAAGERSPAHARNAGAAHARAEWILFLDADCRPAPGLLDAYFAEPVAADVGALVGEVVPGPDGGSVVSRYGSERNFLSQEAHLAHPFRPRAAAANLMVRREAFEQLGGFFEGLRAAEDTDFSWRLQEAGWRLELRPAARVEHRYRTTLRELRRQWRGYAAGRAWLARRYQGFDPEPALARAVRRRGRGRANAPAAPRRRAFLAIDALLAADELAGFTLSNRPAHDRLRPAPVVFVAERFPAAGDPLVDLASAVEGARIEAVARPDRVATTALRIDYREDDGIAARARALVALLARHPVRCARDVLRRSPGEPSLSALAPAVRRLRQDSGARVQPIGHGEADSTARRLKALA
jgi:GT2 family glycosyltransferase